MRLCVIRCEMDIESRLVVDRDKTLEAVVVRTWESVLVTPMDADRVHNKVWLRDV